MSASLYNISIEKRACFSSVLTLINSGGSVYNLSGVTGNIYNLSGVTLTGQIRRNFDYNLQAVFTSQILNTGSGIVSITLSSNETSNLDISASSWDLFADKSGQCSEKLLYGSVTILDNRTK